MAFDELSRRTLRQLRDDILILESTLSRYAVHMEMLRRQVASLRDTLLVSPLDELPTSVIALLAEHLDERSDALSDDVCARVLCVLCERIFAPVEIACTDDDAAVLAGAATTAGSAAAAAHDDDNDAFVFVDAPSTPPPPPSSSSSLRNSFSSGRWRRRRSLFPQIVHPPSLPLSSPPPASASSPLSSLRSSLSDDAVMSDAAEAVPALALSPSVPLMAPSAATRVASLPPTSPLPQLSDAAESFARLCGQRERLSHLRQRAFRDRRRLTVALNERFESHTENDADGLEDDAATAIELLERQRHRAHSHSEMTAEKWAAYVDSDGRIVNGTKALERIFYGGISHEIRSTVWRYLLGMCRFDMTVQQCAHALSLLHNEYSTLKAHWQRILAMADKQKGDLNDEAQRLLNCKKRIEKDVVRTDPEILFFAGPDNPNIHMMTSILMTYAVYRPHRGYVQGMSDLLAPVLAVMENEADAYWCFARQMDLIGGRFDGGQSYIIKEIQKILAYLQRLDPQLHALLVEYDAGNLYFCFRWLLINFKREFNFSEVLRLWEATWTFYLTDELHIFVALSLLQSARADLLSKVRSFDDILRITNGLSCALSIEAVLRQAEDLYWRTVS